MTIPHYILWPMLVLAMHYENFPRAWRFAWAKVRRWRRVRGKVWLDREIARYNRKLRSFMPPPVPKPKSPKSPGSQIVLPNGDVMKIGVTNIQTECTVEDVARGSVEFFVLNDNGNPYVVR